MRRVIPILIIIVCLLASSGCMGEADRRNWTVADLRWLGGAEAPTPATDLIAVYTRTLQLTVDIRLEMLDIAQNDPYRVVLSFWDERDYRNEPLVIEIYSNGVTHTRGNGPGKPKIWPRVMQNFELDTISISLNRFLVGGHFHVDVATYTTNPDKLAEWVRDISSEAQPQVNRANALLAFWNTFPAATPAQAFRRWDGAHTGPLRSRHGLRYVLDGAANYGVPLFLVDLKTPENLAALYYIQGTGKLGKMLKWGLLGLPDVAYAEPAEAALSFSRSSAKAFNLPVSQFVYAANGALQGGYRAQFLNLPDGDHLAEAGGMRLIPLPGGTAEEATENGPSLELRQKLIRAALSGDPGEVVTLGGSLPDSTWGDPEMANPTYAWLSAHPWIRMLNANDLLALPVEGSYNPPKQETTQALPLLSALESAPNNAAGKAAWEAYLQLSAPAEEEGLEALREAYLPDVYTLIAAAEWAENPRSKADCGKDLNADGRMECILANGKYFASLDPLGGRLTNLFYLDEKGAHQLIGETSQFAVGLSDPSEWNPTKGEAADPSMIQGAFADSPDTGMVYAASFSTISEAGDPVGGITFTSTDGRRIKTYSLTEDGLEVNCRLPHEELVRVPLAVEAQAFFEGPSFYRPTIAPHDWTWSRQGGLSVQVRSDATVTAQGFVASYPFLFMPEDPNLDYPSGHYLPFPMSMLTLQGKKEFNVSIGAK